MFNKIMTFLTGLVFGMALAEFVIPTPPTPPTPATTEPPRIWSRLCAKRDMDFIARQADGKRWAIDCVIPGVRL